MRVKKKTHPIPDMNSEALIAKVCRRRYQIYYRIWFDVFIDRFNSHSEDRGALLRSLVIPDLIMFLDDL
jgi:hypothetical protein